MADRETVITHLQIIHTWAEFARERNLQFFTAKHLEDIAQWADDAMNLLKEQEAVEPYSMNAERTYGICPKCGKIVFRYGNVEENHYCGVCGKTVKWDGTFQIQY